MIKKAIPFILSLVILFSVGILIVHAQDTTVTNPGNDTTVNGPQVQVKLENPLKVGDSLDKLLEAIIRNIIMPIGGILAVLSFIFAGFMYVTAQGNEGKIKKANTALLYAAIGTVVLLGSWVIANLLRNTVNQVITS